MPALMQRNAPKKSWTRCLEGKQRGRSSLRQVVLTSCVPFVFSREEVVAAILAREPTAGLGRTVRPSQSGARGYWERTFKCTEAIRFGTGPTSQTAAIQCGYILGRAAG